MSFSGGEKMKLKGFAHHIICYNFSRITRLVFVSNTMFTFALQEIRELFKQIMDCQSSISPPTEPIANSLAVESVNSETTEAIVLVAKKLATIGDELSQSYELSSGNVVNIAKSVPSAVLEGCLDIVNLLLKASR